MNPGRLARCREALAERGLAGALATPGVNFEYLSGHPLERSERLVCLGVPRSGEPWMACPAFEEERLRRGIPEVELVPWEEDEDPFRIVARRLGAGETWAVEPSTRYHDARRLAEAASGVRFVDGAPVFEDLRRAKDEAELTALRRAVAAAWEVYDEIVGWLRAGRSEAEVAGRIEAAFDARGFDGWALVQFGPSGALPHGEPGERRLEPGTAVLVDWGGWRDGFTADLTRTFWWDGEPVPPNQAPTDFREVLEVVRTAQRAAIERARPGVACEAVDAAAREVIGKAGYRDRFVHRTGHGLGREIHEAPWLVAGNSDPLREGDVVTIEPGIYLPDRFGVRREDDVRVTGDGVEVLSAR